MLSVKCHFVNGLYSQTSLAVNAFQQQVTVITIRMCKNDGLENYLKKKKKKIFFFFLYFHIREVLPHSRECGNRAAFPGGSRMMREGSHVCPIIYYCSQLSFTTMSFPECMSPI